MTSSTLSHTTTRKESYEGKELFYLLGNKDDLILNHIQALSKASMKGISLRIKKDDCKISFIQKDKKTKLEIEYERIPGQQFCLRSEKGLSSDYSGFPIYKDDIHQILIEGIICPNIMITESAFSNQHRTILSLDLPEAAAKTLINKLYKKDDIIEIKYKLLEKGQSRIEDEKEWTLSETDKSFIKNIGSILKSLDVRGYTNDTQLATKFLAFQEAYNSFTNEETWFKDELYIIDFINFLDENFNNNIEKTRAEEPATGLYPDAISELMDHNEINHKYNIGTYAGIHEWLQDRKLKYLAFFQVGNESAKKYRHAQGIFLFNSFYANAAIKDYYRKAMNNISLLSEQA